MNKLYKIPYGISNYQIIAREGYAYIDKTRFIALLEENPDPYIFVLRPRRFGKSLWVSILNYYYDRNESCNFELLFGQTDIGRLSTQKRNKYYILNFDFSGVITDNSEELKDSFSKKVRNSLNSFINRYHLNIEHYKDENAVNLLSEFLEQIGTLIDGQIYVIIDEYDHFANELISFNLELFSDAVTKHGFIRKWYEVLKIGSKTVVGRMFATGVSPITLDSLTSGFNIGDNLTKSPRFNEMMGFTEDDVSWLISNTLPLDLQDFVVARSLREYYNGYLFSVKSMTRSFNSDMILYYLKEYLNLGEPPEKLLDYNIASDYGKIEGLLRLKNPEDNMYVIKEVIDTNQTVALITDQFSLKRGFSKDDFKSLLFYLGLLTIKDSIHGRVHLQIPNYVIKGLYYDYFAKTIADTVQYKIDSERVNDAIYQIAYMGRSDMIVSLIEEVLHEFSNRDFIKFDEKYIKVLFFAYLYMSDLYLVKSEYEVSDGYIDIAIFPREPLHPEYYAIFELKYLKKGDADESAVNKVLEEGIAQIKRYSSSSDLMSLPNLKKWVLVFAGDRCRVNYEYSTNS